MTLQDAGPMVRVIYIPLHANGDMNHPDVEKGTISSSNHKYVFVKFDKQLDKFGWEGTTSQSCDPNDLVILAKQKDFYMEDDFIKGWIIYLLIVTILVLAVTYSYDKRELRKLKSQAISLHYAEYNSTNGVWQWKTNK